MSEQRQTDNVPAVDQGTRGQQLEEQIPEEEDIIATLRQQLTDLETKEAEAREQAKRDQQGREAERKRAEQAEQRAREAETRARTDTETSRRSEQDAQLDAINSTLEARNEQMTALKRELQAHMAEGDFGKAADVQATMAKLGGQITTLEAGKTALEARKATPQQQQPEQRQPPTEAENQENFIRQQPALVQTWLRDHRERYFGDSTFRDKVTAAAQYATNIKGIPGDSQEFIEYVEQEVGLRQLPQQQQQPSGGGREADPGPQRQPASNRMVTAPVGGSVPNTQGGGSANQVYLTRDEKALAAQMGVTEAEYAKHKRDLQNEGQIGTGARGAGR